jgi:N-acetylmuramoyl-L-alanine amidase
VIRRTVMPSALVEMGFVTGSLDSPRLADPAFRRRLAVALANGLLRYLVANP